ncbi:MAG: GPW/gp25 family protein [Pseudomonadota bacterium]
MFLSQPYRVDGTGRTAAIQDAHAHARDLIEAVLFTAPGERVNRPTFGSGIYEMLFDANNQALETAADFLIQSAIQQHLSDIVTVEGLEIQRNEGLLEIKLTYGLRGEEERVTDTFTREI